MASTNSIAKERIKPGAWLPPWTVAEHQARYNFSANFVNDRQVVDCACGNGVGARIFLNKSPKDFHGFDVDQDAVGYASRKIVQDNVTFQKASALSLPLSRESKDLYISLETIEHIQDDDRFVQEVHRVLKPNGIFICSTPNRLITNPGSVLEDAPWNHFHIREYSPSELADLLRRYFFIEGWYGQNKNFAIKVYILNKISKIFGKQTANLLNKALKCRWFLFKNKKIHLVRSTKQPELHEYMVVVCRRKGE